jgi:asparagine synthase (glutamine-hydrolysing)
MCNQIVHRGPDDEGTYLADFIGLGQRRLSIIDLDRKATPPLKNEDESIVIVFNGEIYNYLELRKSLEYRGHIFRTKSDTETIIHLYEEYGERCVEYLRGMYAFAIWDSRKHLLFAARDRVGKKPFFYYKDAKQFVFGSEIKALLADKSILRTPNFMALDAYLSYQYVPSPLSAFDEIYKLQPGHHLTCTVDGNLTIKRYWYPPVSSSNPKSIEEIENELNEKLKESVRYRMLADVPIGAFLSGGIDSGMMVALMAQHCSSPIKTFSIGFEEQTHNELPYARMVSNKYGTDHHELVVKPVAMDILPKMISSYDEPFADSSAIPTYYVSNMASKYVKVAVSGDGGDECFGGYIHYQKMLQLGKFDFIPENIRSVIVGTAHRAIDGFARNNRMARLSRGLQMLSSSLPERYRIYMSIFKDQEKKYLYERNFLDWLDINTVQHILGQPTGVAGVDPLKWMIQHDQRHYLSDCLMTKMDIASMSNSLEVRSPLLDREVIELAATIPNHFKIADAQGKWIMRHLAKRYLPAEIFKKRKTGFAVPLASWLRGELSGLLRDILLDSRSRQRGFINQQYVKIMVEEHINCRRDWSNRLWALLFMEMWFRKYIDSSS